MPEEREYVGKCSCGGRLFRRDPAWAACDTCWDDTFPLRDFEAGMSDEPGPIEELAFQQNAITRFEDLARGGHLTVVTHQNGDVDVVIGPPNTPAGLPTQPAYVKFTADKKKSPRTWRALHELADAMRLDREYDHRRKDTP